MHLEFCRGKSQAEALGGIVMHSGVVMLAKARIDRRETAMGFDHAGLERQRHAKRLRGVIEITQPRQGDAERVMGFGVSLPPLKCVKRMAGRLLEASFKQRDAGQCVMRFHVIWVERHRAGRGVLPVSQPSGRDTRLRESGKG